MNVSLTPELERLVQRKVKSGEYQTASEVIREGLRLLKERDRTEWLRAEIQKGIDAIERGDYKDYDEKTSRVLAEQIKREGRRTLATMAKARRK
jgi:antitoxin ParD1/3/4